MYSSILLLKRVLSRIKIFAGKTFVSQMYLLFHVCTRNAFQNNININLHKYDVTGFIEYSHTSFWSRPLVCSTCGGGRKGRWPMFPLPFFWSSWFPLYSFFLLLFTHFGDTPEAEMLFTLIFLHKLEGITKKINHFF